ncbi:hypothetical protein ACQPXM_01215 [Kribbella sp. CA-253562]|uniref:hypothetical protein n=1 Tax=Kribbella sp. CA-253562 TaxID=3239942 RepID=UPI003D8A7282
MAFELHRGETIELKGRRITVTATAWDSLPRVRDHLIEVARRRGSTTYGQLKADLDLPHATNGLGRLLDLLSVDCQRRGEPSLAAIVVNATTDEVGSDFGGDAVAERRDLYTYWT